MVTNVAELCESQQITLAQLADRTGLEESRVAAIALKNLVGTPRRAFDEDDVANSAFREFLSRAAAGKIMPKIVMYCTAICPYCVQAERLLHTKGVTEIEKIRVDLDPAHRTEMMERSARRTVPQIYIGDIHVGGYEDLLQLDRNDELAKLLAA